MSAYQEIEKLAADALEQAQGSYPSEHLLAGMGETIAHIERIAHEAEHHGQTKDDLSIHRLPEPIYNRIHEAIGQASMCWLKTPTGVFDSKRAGEIAGKLCEYVADLLHIEPLTASVRIANVLEQAFDPEKRAFRLYDVERRKVYSEALAPEVGNKFQMAGLDAFRPTGAQINPETARELLGMSKGAFEAKWMTDAAFHATVEIIVRLLAEREVEKRKQEVAGRSAR